MPSRTCPSAPPPTSQARPPGLRPCGTTDFTPAAVDVRTTDRRDEPCSSDPRPRILARVTFARALLLLPALLLACSDDGSDTSLPGTQAGPATTAATDDPAGTTTAATASTASASASDPTTTTATTSASTTTADPTTADPTTATTTTTDATTGAPACPGGGLGPGDHDISLDVDGVTRTAIVHVPPGYDPTAPTPLVLNLHGFTSNAGQQISLSGMNSTADANNFIVAYGEGLNSSWNAGGCCGLSLSQNIDDVGFLRALVEHLETELCIDRARVYSTGMSNGGFMSHRLACEAADMFAAVGPVSATIGLPDCDPGRPVPVILFNGTLDNLVPYPGGLFPGAQAVFAAWAERNGCTDAPEVTKQSGLATCETHDDCDDGASVTLCTFEGMGHCWPGTALCPWGAANTDLDADDEMWAFFSQFTLP